MSSIVSMPFELNAPRSTVTGETLLGVSVVLVLKAPPLSAANAGAIERPRLVPAITIPAEPFVIVANCCAIPKGVAASVVVKILSAPKAAKAAGSAAPLLVTAVTVVPASSAQDFAYETASNEAFLNWLFQSSTNTIIDLRLGIKWL